MIKARRMKWAGHEAGMGRRSVHNGNARRKETTRKTKKHNRSLKVAMQGPDFYGQCIGEMFLRVEEVVYFTRMKAATLCTIWCHIPKNIIVHYLTDLITEVDPVPSLRETCFVNVM
jgi:hypothetical protein